MCVEIGPAPRERIACEHDRVVVVAPAGREEGVDRVGEGVRVHRGLGDRSGRDEETQADSETPAHAGDQSTPGRTTHDRPFHVDRGRVSATMPRSPAGDALVRRWHYERNEMPELWIGFIVIILACMAFDLVVIHKKDKPPNLNEAMKWTAFWVAIGVAFSGAIYWIYETGFDGQQLEIRPGVFIDGAGEKAAILYLTGYLLEQSLSVDNLFVMAMVFSNFAVPREHQHRVLFWGILGAIVMRAIMIIVGISLVQKFAWLFYVFGAYLIYAGAKLFKDEDDDTKPEEQSFLERMVRKVLPISENLEGESFVTRVGGKFSFTPLVLCLLAIEGADVVFALDSIPAVLGVSVDKLIVYTSNIFAVLGLRSMYSVLVEAMERFKHLKTSVAIILIFVGVKLAIHNHVHIHEAISLGIIGTCLAVGVVRSWNIGKAEEYRLSQLPPEEPK